MTSPAWPFPKPRISYTGFHPSDSMNPELRRALTDACGKVFARYALSNEARISAWYAAVRHPKRALEIYSAILEMDRRRDER